MSTDRRDKPGLQHGDIVLGAQGIDPKQAKRDAKRPRRELTGRQIVYVSLVARGVPPREAARQAGFNPDHASNLTKMPHILLAIDEAKRNLPKRAPKAAPSDSAASLSPPGFPAIIDPGSRPPAVAFVDGFTVAGGPLRAAQIPTAGERDVAIQMARDLSTCFPREVYARWSEHQRSEIEGLLDRPFEKIVPANHHPAYYLAERCWFDNVLDDPRYLYAPLHRDMFLVPVCDYILDPDPPHSGILYLGPRFTYKSTFSHGVIPQWYVFRGAHLSGIHYAVVLRHHKFELASDNLMRMKAKYMHHPWVRAVWAPACPPEKQREFGDKFRFTLPWVPPGQTADPSFRAAGFVSTDTGRHPDLDMGDDLVTEEHITSKVVRDDAKRRYHAKRYQLDIRTGREVNTGTPYHRMDLWSMMINSTMNGQALYRVVQVPAHLPPEMHAQFGPLAHPHKLSEKDLERRRLEEIANAGNDDLYYLQFEVTYRLSRKQTTETWWLRECELADVPEDGLPIITIDPAWKGDANYGEGDSASIQVWVLARRGSSVVRYLVDGVHSNELSPADGESETIRLMSRYGVTIVAPELPTGSTWRQNLVQSCGALGMRLQIVDLKTKQRSKPDRIGGLLREFEAGRVFLCKTADPVLLEEFRSQFHNWPEVDHDDALDSAAYTCDPAVLEAWAPAWGSARPNRPWTRRQQAPESYRTRYTTI